MNQRGFTTTIIGLIAILVIAVGIGGYVYMQNHSTSISYDYYTCENGIFYRTNSHMVDTGAEYFDAQGKKIGECDTWGVVGENCKESRARAGQCNKRE